MKLEMKSVMKKYFFMLMLTLGMCIPSQVNATHIVGGDMSYRCLGNDFYEVTLTLRRDCINGAEDAPFDDRAAVGIFDKTGRKLDFVGRLGILYMPFMGADTIRNNVPQCALDGDPICVSEAVYVSEIYLPFREQGYVLTYQRCCRNGTLNNIVNPTEVGATRTVCITRESQLECNSGPAFGKYPDIIVCANEEFSFDASATDPDGDNLVYRLATPYTGASIDYPKPQPPWNPPYNSFVEYSEGFSEENMLGSGTPLTIDENTGLLTATPSIVGQYLVGIIVEEWRDGEKIGETWRDFEINVRVCQTFPEVAFTAEDNCGGLTVDIQNNTTGAISYQWNFNHPSTDEAFMSTDEQPGSFTYPEPGIYTIRLEATDAEGICVVDLEQEVIALNSQLESSFTSSNGCCFEGVTEISLVATSEELTPDYEIESYEYSVVINGEMPFTLSGANNTFNVDCDDVVEVTLTTISSSGCMSTVTETITIDQDFGSGEGNICMEEIMICVGDNGTVGPLNDTRTYEWTPDSTIDLTDPLNPVFSPNVTTIYTVVSTDENGAKSTGTVTVNVIQGFDLEINDVVDMECDSIVTFSTSQNRDDLTFEWAFSDNFENVLSTENPVDLNMMLGSNTIFVRATSPEGCTEVTSIFVTSLNSKLTSSFDSGNGCCIDGVTEVSLVATSVEPSPDYEIESYEYSVVINGEMPFTLSGANNTFNVGCDDVVEVTLTTISSSGCMSTVTEAIVIDQDFGSGEGNLCMEEIIICVGNTGTVGPLNESRTYDWTPTNSTIDLSDPLNPIFSPTETTVYTVVATDQNGGKSTGNVTVTVIASFGLEIDPIENMECENSVMFSTSQNRDDLTFEWARSVDFEEVISTDNPATIEMMAGTNTIYVRATSPEGCTEVTSTSFESSILSLNTVVNEYNACEDDFTTVTVENMAEGQNVSVVWDASDNITSDNLNNASIDIHALGSEEVISLSYTATNDKGCMSAGTVDVEVSRSISADISGITTSCDGDFNLLATSNASGAMFEWSFSSDFNEIESTDANFTPTLTENATVYMRASVGEVCLSEIVSEPLRIGEFDLEFGTLPAEICIGDEIIIEGTSTDPTVSIEYGPSDNILETISASSIRVGVISGQSQVTVPYVATNDAGCEVTGELTIAVGSTEQPTVAFEVDCSTGDVVFTSDRPDGTVLWNFGDSNSDDNTSSLGNPTHRYSTGGTYTVVLSSASETCMFESVETIVEVPELFSLTPNGSTDVLYCDNEEVTLGVTTTGDVTIVWEDENGNELGNTNEITINPNGSINTVKAIATSTDPACGMSMIEFTLSQYIFDITLGANPDLICGGTDFNLSVTNNTDADLTYEWSPASAVVNGGNTASPTFNVDVDTDIIVSITNAEFGCSREESFSVDVSELSINVEADPNETIFLCDEVEIFATPGDLSSYSWSNGVSGSSQTVAPTETTTYTVTATDANGCTAEGSVTITVEIPPCSEAGIFVPTAFSPNNDSNNDVLLVRSNAVKEMDFFVTDRWGNEVFRTTNQDEGWNGKFRNDGRELSSDVYAWCLVATCSDGNDIHLVGNVSLLR